MSTMKSLKCDVNSKMRVKMINNKINRGRSTRISFAFLASSPQTLNLSARVLLFTWTLTALGEENDRDQLLHLLLSYNQVLAIFLSSTWACYLWDRIQSVLVSGTMCCTSCCFWQREEPHSALLTQKSQKCGLTKHRECLVYLPQAQS